MGGVFAPLTTGGGSGGGPVTAAPNSYAEGFSPDVADIETAVETIATRTPVLGQALMAGSVPVALASNQPGVPITAAALPLPTGAATQTSVGATAVSAASIDGKTPALGQALAAASVPVVLPSDQLPLPVLPAVAATHVTTTITIAAGVGALAARPARVAVAFLAPLANAAAIVVDGWPVAPGGVYSLACVDAFAMTGTTGDVLYATETVS